MVATMIRLTRLFIKIWLYISYIIFIFPVVEIDNWKILALKEKVRMGTRLKGDLFINLCPSTVLHSVQGILLVF